MTEVATHPSVFKVIRTGHYDAEAPMYVGPLLGWMGRAILGALRTNLVRIEGPEDRLAIPTEISVCTDRERGRSPVLHCMHPTSLQPGVQEKIYWLPVRRVFAHSEIDRTDPSTLAARCGIALSEVLVDAKRCYGLLRSPAEQRQVLRNMTDAMAAVPDIWDSQPPLTALSFVQDMGTIGSAALDAVCKTLDLPEISLRVALDSN